MALSSNSQIDKPQRGHPKRAELPDANINTGMQSINTESLFETSPNSITIKKDPIFSSCMSTGHGTYYC